MEKESRFISTTDYDEIGMPAVYVYDKEQEKTVYVMKVSPAFYPRIPAEYGDVSDEKLWGIMTEVALKSVKDNLPEELDEQFLKSEYLDVFKKQ